MCELCHLVSLVSQASQFTSLPCTKLIYHYPAKSHVSSYILPDIGKLPWILKLIHCINILVTSTMF